MSLGHHLHWQNTQSHILAFLSVINWFVIFVSFVGAFRANGFLEAEEERAGADLEPDST
jgi:hypothetical protein